jgi:hypothetical protein
MLLGRQESWRFTWFPPAMNTDPVVPTVPTFGGTPAWNIGAA